MVLAKRSGVDLRPVDRERVQRFDEFAVVGGRARRLGVRPGLTLYARAAFVLLEQLVDEDPARVEVLFKDAGVVSGIGNDSDA